MHVRGPARRQAPLQRLRRGVSTLDYILVLGIVLPLLAVIGPQGGGAMQWVYEMTATLVGWPFL